MEEREREGITCCLCEVVMRGRKRGEGASVRDNGQTRCHKPSVVLVHHTCSLVPRPSLALLRCSNKLLKVSANTSTVLRTFGSSC